MRSETGYVAHYFIVVVLGAGLRPDVQGCPGVQVCERSRRRRTHLSRAPERVGTSSLRA